MTASWREALLAPMLERGKALAARFDALPVRQRGAAFGAVVALVIAVEGLVVSPTQAKRLMIQQAAVEQIQREADERDEAAQERTARRQALEDQLAAVDRELGQMGAGATSGQPLSFLLNRALARQAVDVVSLREMMVESIVAPEPAAAAGAVEEAATAVPTPTLYRHRFEVTLGGTPTALIDALAALDVDARPLRVERVRMTGRPAAKVEMAVTLTVVGTERSWLSI